MIEKSRLKGISGDNLIQLSIESILVIQGPVKLNLEYFQWGMFHHFLRQPVPLCSYSEELFPCIQTEFSLKCPCACSLLSGHHAPS